MSETKAQLTMKLKSKTGFQSTVSAGVTPEQWADICTIVEGEITSREITLRQLLGDIVDTVGVPYDAVDAGCVTVDENRINAARIWLKENP